MKVRKLAISWAVIAALSAPALLSADEPSSRPAGGPNSMTPRRPMRGPNGRGAARAYSQQEWDEMMAFLSKNSPERYHVLRNADLSEDAPLRAELIRKWRNYNIVKENFPELAAKYERQFQLEDDLFDLTMKARLNPNDTQYHDLIHDKVAALFALSLDQRKIRVDKLQKMLEQEKQSLTDDEKNKDQIIQTLTSQKLADVYGGSSPDNTRPASQNSPDVLELPDHIAPK